MRELSSMSLGEGKGEPNKGGNEVVVSHKRAVSKEKADLGAVGQR